MVFSPRSAVSSPPVLSYRSAVSSPPVLSYRSAVSSPPVLSYRSAVSSPAVLMCRAADTPKPTSVEPLQQQSLDTLALPVPQELLDPQDPLELLDPQDPLELLDPQKQKNPHHRSATGWSSVELRQHLVGSDSNDGASFGTLFNNVPREHTTGNVPREHTTGKRRFYERGGKLRSGGRSSSCSSRRFVPQSTQEVLWQDSGRLLSEDYKTSQLAKLPKSYGYRRTFKGTYGVINYDLTGVKNKNGPLVVCLHGLGDSMLRFAEFEEYLPKFGFRLLLYDSYGHGLSQAPKYEIGCRRRHKRRRLFGLDFHVEQLIEVLDHLMLKDETMDLIGFSMGCLVAAGFADRFPDSVSRIVLISPVGIIDKFKTPGKWLRCCKCCIPVARKLFCRCCYCESLFLQKDKSFGRTVSSEEKRQQLVAFDKFLYFAKPAALDAYCGTIAEMPLWDGAQLYSDMAQKSGAPVLLLWGAQDHLTGGEAVKSLQRSLPNAHLIVFENAGHSVDEEESLLVVANALSFLDMQPTSAMVMKDVRYFLPCNPRGKYVRSIDRISSEAGQGSCHPRRVFRVCPTPVNDKVVSHSYIVGSPGKCD